jgi:hypothetical protein
VKEEELTSEEARFLLRLIEEHREYWRVLAGSSKASGQSRARHELIEVLARKLGGVCERARMAQERV